MTLVVAGVTGATIFVTQARVKANYQKLFEERFEAQLRFFSQSRTRLLEAVARRCEEVAQSEPVVAAMKKSGAVQRLAYAGVVSQMPDYFKGPDRPGASGPPAPAPPPDKEHKRNGQLPPMPRLTGVPLVRLIDAKGGFIEPLDPRLSFFKRRKADKDKDKNKEKAEAKSAALGEKQLEQIHELLRLDKPLDAWLTGQEVGYTEVEVAGAKEHQIHQVIVTPIRDGETFLGALMLSIPVGDYGERQMSDFSEKELISGIWLDGRIFTKTIPQAAIAEVEATVGEHVQETEDIVRHTVVMVDGVPHRLFKKLLNPDSPFPPAAQVCLYSLKDSLAEQATLRDQIMGFGLLALLVAIGVILVISRNFSKPIEQLAMATRRISEGDFSVKVPVKSGDEVGALAKAFNEMADELALKERYKTVLAQVTDKEVAEQLINGKMTLGGEVRKVSVLFCDIRGFTALTENMPPAEVITMLNEHMTAMNRIVHEHYGVVDKFVGDLIMAVFGAPKSYGNDALHAVKCAMDMISERRRLNVDSRHSFEIGIGVATGEVVAGCMGSDDRLNYTVLGERVNLASRLCSNAGGTELLIDENTYLQLPENFLVEATAPLLLKGFSSPTPAYRLIEAAVEDEAAVGV